MELDESWGRTACSLSAHSCGYREGSARYEVSPGSGDDSNRLGSLATSAWKRDEEEPAQSIAHRHWESPRASKAQQGQTEGKAGGGKLIFLSMEEEALSL